MSTISKLSMVAIAALGIEMLTRTGATLPPAPPPPAVAATIQVAPDTQQSGGTSGESVVETTVITVVVTIAVDVAACVATSGLICPIAMPGIM